MKKTIVLISVLCVCLMVKAGEDKFIDALRNCSSYSDSGVVNTDGITAKSTKQILGWQDNKCKYKENINFGTINADITCHFTKAQIKEITSVADAYFLTLKYSGEQADTSSLDAVKNNPVTNVFNKYIQDSSVCTMSGLE